MATRMADHMSENMGSLLAGVIASAVLLGVSLVQTFYYYMTYPNDKWYLKALVAVTAILDTAHQMMISHTMWHYLILNYNQPKKLEFVIWSVIIESLCTGVTGALVQLFYVMRIWLLCKSKILTGCILLLVLTSAGWGTSWVILSMRQSTFDDLLTISPVTITVDSLSAATDVAIACTLVIMLHRARTGFKKSDNMINKLMLFIVNTGVLTSCCALVSLFILVGSPLTLIYAPLYFCLGRLYTNSLLATLNARELIKKKAEESSHMLVSMPQTLINPHNPSPKHSAQNISIKIERTQEYDHSEEPSKDVHNLDRKLDSDEELTQINALPRSIRKERESREYSSIYPV